MSEAGLRRYHNPACIALLIQHRHVTALSTCEQVEWRDDPDALRRWQEGTTGLPLVDANMREMAQTGAWRRVGMLLNCAQLTDWSRLCDGQCQATVLAVLIWQYMPAAASRRVL